MPLRSATDTAHCQAQIRTNPYPQNRSLQSQPDTKAGGPLGGRPAAPGRKTAAAAWTPLPAAAGRPSRDGRTWGGGPNGGPGRAISHPPMSKTRQCSRNVALTSGGGVNDMVCLGRGGEGQGYGRRTLSGRSLSSLLKCRSRSNFKPLW